DRQGALQPCRRAWRPVGPRSRAKAHAAAHGPVLGPGQGRWRGGCRSRAALRRAEGVMIHPTALVDPGARIGANVSIGAYSIIGPEVEIGEGTSIGPHVVIESNPRIGRDNRIWQFASLGAAPQDKKFHGES